jgi:hypothetical protein
MVLFVALAAASLISCVGCAAAGGCGTETIGAGLCGEYMVNIL